MGYQAANLKMGREFGIFRNHEWFYDGFDDDAAEINTAGYIANGDALGMQVGDRVLVTIWAGALPTGGHPAYTDTMTLRSWFEVVSVTQGGAADLSNGDALTLTDSD